MLSYRDQEMRLNRYGSDETVWLDLDYSPILDEAGTPVGVFSVVVETTKRVLAERELREEQAQREAAWRQQLRIYEDAPGFILILRGANHVVEFVNRTHQRLFNSAGWVGRPLREVLTGVDPARLALIDQVYNTGEAMTRQGAEVSRDAIPGLLPEVRYLTLTYAPLTDDAGKVSGIICQGFDVSDNEALRRREAALGALAKQIAEIDDAEALGRAAMQVAAQTLSVSRVGYAAIEVESGALVPVAGWSAPGLQAVVGQRALQRLGAVLGPLQRGETVTIEDLEATPGLLALPEGELEAMGIRSGMGVPILRQGRLMGLIHATAGQPRHWGTEDIDFLKQLGERTVEAIERRRAEERVRRNEARLRFLDELNRMVVPLSDAGDILKTITRLLGEHLGVAHCTYADFEEDAEHFAVRDEWQAPGGPGLGIMGRYRLSDYGPTAGRRLRGGQPLVIEDVRQDLPAAETPPFEALKLSALIALPLVKAGRLKAMLAVYESSPRRWSADEIMLVRDVSERAWAHVERLRAETRQRAAEAQLRAELEAKVEQRSFALQQAQRLEAIGRLTGGVAHDFNNLLTAVLGNLDMLRNRLPPDPMTSRLVDHAMEAARRGAALTRRLQLFAQRREPRAERTDVTALIGSLGELIGRTLGPMLSLGIRVADDLPQPVVDPSLLEAALLDMLLAARDATDGRGQVQLIAEAAAADAGMPPGDYVRIAVAASLTGTDTPLRTGEAADRSRLATVASFAEAAGGRLRITALPGPLTAELWLPEGAEGEAMGERRTG